MPHVVKANSVLYFRLYLFTHSFIKPIFVRRLCVKSKNIQICYKFTSPRNVRCARDKPIRDIHIYIYILIEHTCYIYTEKVRRKTCWFVLYLPAVNNAFQHFCWYSKLHSQTQQVHSNKNMRDNKSVYTHKSCMERIDMYTYTECPKSRR